MRMLKSQIATRASMSLLSRMGTKLHALCVRIIIWGKMPTLPERTPFYSKTMTTAPTGNPMGASCQQSLLFHYPYSPSAHRAFHPH